ncbi:MAG: tRNA (N(6)-L-threonylcarbamoyladenosine(37)-C(2))-methylthiotransferase MtaB [Massiliimalia sp.]
MRVGFYTLGCKVNQYETEVLKSRFAKAGFDVVSDEDFADVYVLNSCTVTASGDKKTRQILHRMKRQNPNAVIALCGCMPQAFPEKSALLSDAQVITGASRARLLEDVKKALETGERIVDITPHEKGEAFEPMKAEHFSEKTRAFVKIEDGCDRYCSYCIIPMARGPIRSKPLAELEAEVRQLVQNGYREMVLVGINLSSYGKECGLRLIDAVELVCGIEGVERVRLGSLEPELLLDEDIRRMAAQPKFCPQFHLSLQSGCDATLKRMNRHYDSDFYYDLVCKLRNVFPDCSITTDIMVGFAGETEQEFEESLAFAKKVGFAKAHVFAYSVREGTRAAKFPGQLDRKTKEARSRRMIEATEQTRCEFLKQQVGKVYPVLFEHTRTEEGIEGYTKNYIPVFVPSEEDLATKIYSVRITGVSGDHCIGEIV